MARKMSQWVARLRERDGDNCQLCLQPIDFSLDPHDWMAKSVDHIRPQVYGGPTVLSNLRLAHRKCNSSRGADWNGERLVSPAARRERGKKRRGKIWDEWACRPLPGGLVIGDEPVLPCG